MEKLLTNNEIVEEIYEPIILNQIHRMKIERGDMDDLIQEICLILLEYDNEKLNTIYNKKQLAFYVNRIITNQYYSKTSPFYKKYKQFNLLQDKNISDMRNLNIPDA